jgi:hypothetical protein
VRSDENNHSAKKETLFPHLAPPSHETKILKSLKDICSDLFTILVRYDSVLTIKQLYDIKKHLCKKYSIKHFSQLSFDDNEDDGDGESNSLDLVSFIHKHRDKIDLYGDLSIYDYVSTVSDRQELYSFVNQLVVFKNWSEKQEQNQSANNRTTIMTKDQLSAVERALQYKFPGLIGNSRVAQIVKKAKQQPTQKTRSTIR